MNITKRDVLELRRRLKKTECTFSRMCGCYVNSGKQVVLKFGEPFLDLEEDEFYKYLEIAKKALSGTLGNNLLELEFERTDDAAERQQFLLTLKGSKLQNPDLLDRLYEQIIENYIYPGNYLILTFHDVYDVMTRTTDRSKLDESEEIYEYMICAVCPVELSKPGLGYREDENRIGVRERDWIVGAPDLGFVYPAFSDRGSDTHAVMYYVKNAKESHPEFIRSVLGCEVQRTATEEKAAFESIVKNAFGEEDEQADAAFIRIQRSLNDMVAESEEDENLPPVELTAAAVSGVIAEVEMPDEIKQEIERSYTREFGEVPPTAQNLLDSKLIAASAQRMRTIELEQQVSTLKQQLAEKVDAEQDGDAPWADEAAGESAAIVLKVPDEKAEQIKTQVIDGQKCLVIPLVNGESASINGVSAEL